VTVQKARAGMQSRQRPWNFVEDFGADPTGTSDVSAKLTEALKTVVTSDVPVLECFGRFRFAGELQDTGDGGANALVPLPQIDGRNPSSTAQRSLVIRGAAPGPTSGESTVPPAGQTVFEVITNEGSGTLPSFMASRAGLRNNIHLRVENLDVQMPPNPRLSCFNFGMQQDVILEYLLVHTGSVDISNITEPTYNNSYAFIFPAVDKSALTLVRGVMVWGYYTAYRLGELGRGLIMNAESCKIALEIPRAYHVNTIESLGAFECQRVLKAAGDGESRFLIGALDIENANGQFKNWQNAVNHIDDPMDHLYGELTWVQVNANVGQVHTPLIKRGGRHVLSRELGTGVARSGP
jgi:hypothetical protein